jgi:hypothetical protein
MLTRTFEGFPDGVVQVCRKHNNRTWLFVFPQLEWTRPPPDVFIIYRVISCRERCFILELPEIMEVMVRLSSPNRENAAVILPTSNINSLGLTSYGGPVWFVMDSCSALAALYYREPLSRSDIRQGIQVNGQAALGGAEECGRTEFHDGTQFHLSAHGRPWPFSKGSFAKSCGAQEFEGSNRYARGGRRREFGWDDYSPGYTHDSRGCSRRPPGFSNNNRNQTFSPPDQ